MSAWERKAAEVLETVNATVGILYSVETRQAHSKSPGGAADQPMGSWQNTRAGELARSLPESQRKASLIDIQKHTFPLLLFSSALSYAQICRSVFDFSSHASLWNLLFGGITNGGKLWNTPHLRQWQNYCVSPPGCHNPSQSIRSASQLPIQSKAFSGKRERYMAEEKAKPFWADRLQSPAHVVVWHTP